MSNNDKYEDIKQIRILPMGPKEFPNKADVDCYFDGTATTQSGLASKDGQYYYREHTIATDEARKKLNDEDHIFVLFQYDAKMVACGEMERQKKLDPPEEIPGEKGKFYKGYQC